MADEPRFPPAQEAKSNRAAYRTPSARTAEPPEKPRVVARAEPPREEPDGPDARPLAKLSAEETRALLEIESANERGDTFWTLFRRDGW